MFFMNLYKRINALEIKVRHNPDRSTIREVHGRITDLRTHFRNNRTDKIHRLQSLCGSQKCYTYELADVIEQILNHLELNIESVPAKGETLTLVHKGDS